MGGLSRPPSRELRACLHAKGMGFKQLSSFVLVILGARRAQANHCLVPPSNHRNSGLCRMATLRSRSRILSRALELKSM
jgi:hypothetical protein